MSSVHTNSIVFLMAFKPSTQFYKTSLAIVLPAIVCFFLYKLCFSETDFKLYFRFGIIVIVLTRWAILDISQDTNSIFFILTCGTCLFQFIEKKLINIPRVHLIKFNTNFSIIIKLHSAISMF